MANHTSNINSLPSLLLCNIVTGPNITPVKTLSIIAYHNRLGHTEVFLISASQNRPLKSSVQTQSKKWAGRTCTPPQSQFWNQLKIPCPSKLLDELMKDSSAGKEWQVDKNWSVQTHCWAITPMPGKLSHIPYTPGENMKYHFQHWHHWALTILLTRVSQGKPSLWVPSPMRCWCPLYHSFPCWFPSWFWWFFLHCTHPWAQQQLSSSSLRRHPTKQE